VPDEDINALRTPLGRERMLEDHERRIDHLEGRMSAIEGKEASRDRRWDFAFRTIVTIGGGIIVGVVTALISSGTVHP
jgi:hypothetical protein